MVIVPGDHIRASLKKNHRLCRVLILGLIVSCFDLLIFLCGAKLHISINWVKKYVEIYRIEYAETLYLS